MREREGDEVVLPLMFLWTPEASFNSSKRNWIRWEREGRRQGGGGGEGGKGRETENSVVDLLKCCATA